MGLWSYGRGLKHILGSFKYCTTCPSIRTNVYIATFLSSYQKSIVLHLMQFQTSFDVNICFKKMLKAMYSESCNVLTVECCRGYWRVGRRVAAAQAEALTASVTVCRRRVASIVAAQPLHPHLRNRS